MRKSYIADSIMNEYNRKKKYEVKMQKKELNKFIKENCSICKNNDKNLCHIVKDMESKFNCPFMDI